MLRPILTHYNILLSPRPPGEGRALREPAPGGGDFHSVAAHGDAAEDAQPRLAGVVQKQGKHKPRSVYEEFCRAAERAREREQA